jgi:hypothetical protein
MRVYVPTVLSLKQQSALVVVQNMHIPCIDKEAQTIPKVLQDYLDASWYHPVWTIFVEPKNTIYANEWISSFGEKMYNIYQGKQVYICSQCMECLSPFLKGRILRQGLCKEIITYIFPDLPIAVCVFCGMQELSWPCWT